jgi:WD40 repeat protein
LVKHYDPRRGSYPIWSNMAHTARVTGLAWSPDGSMLVTLGSEDGVKCWDARMRRELLPFADSITGIALNERWFSRNKIATMKVGLY